MTELTLRDLRIRIDEQGIHFPEDISRDQWREAGFLLAKASSASTRWVAGWRRCGVIKFGEEIVEHETGQLCFPAVVRSQAKQLALLPEEVFNLGVSPQHAKVLVEECQDLKQIVTWAKKAIHEELTAGELRDSIETGRVVRRSGGHEQLQQISSPYAVRALFDKWATTTLSARPIEEWSPEDLKALLDELRPIWILTEKAAALWKMKRS